MPRALLPLSLVILLTSRAALGAPQLNNVSQQGIQRGEPTTLMFDGGELGPEPKLVSNVPLTTVQIKPESNASRVVVELTVDPAAPPGVYAVRIASPSGISNPLLLAVDALPQKAWAEETTLPVALSGNLGGAEVRKTSFTGAKGQRLVIDVEAQRLGSNFKPVLRLYDAAGRQIAFASSEPWYGGDARLTTTLPADGKYSLQLHDRVYRAGGPGAYRLKIGDLPVADRAHPAAVGTAVAKVALLGGTIPADATREFSPANLIVGNYPLPFPEVANASGPQPNVFVSGHNEVVETALGGVQQAGPASVGISGVLSKAGEEDQFSIEVTPNQHLRVEMQARKLGSPIDGVLSLRNEQGGQMAAADDVPGSTDPLIADFAVPANTTKLIVAVKDLLGRGSAEMNYRVVVRDLAQGDFNVTLTGDRLLIPAGGTQLVPLQVERQGYAGPIRLEFQGLPPNVQVSGAEIAAGSNQALLTITAAADATGAGLLRAVARSESPALARLVHSPALPGSQLTPYLREDIAWGIVAGSPLAVSWTPTSEATTQGAPIAASVQIRRPPNVAGPVRMRLQTTQAPIKKKIKENNQDKEVDDLDRMLRLESETTVAPEANAADVKVFVPADLPTQPWDVVLVAELLSADGKNVVATAYAPTRRLVVSAK